MEKLLVKDLPLETFRELERLNLKRGLMREVLQLCYHSSDIKATTYILRENSKVTSWALVFPEEYRSKGVVKTRLRAYFYTRTTHRRQGLGAILAREVLKDFPEVTIHRWSKESKDFFNKVGLKSWHKGLTNTATSEIL